MFRLQHHALETEVASPQIRDLTKMFDSVPEFHYNDDVREVWTLSNIVVRDKIINFTLLLTNNTCAFSVAASLSPPEVSWFVTLLAVTVDFSTLWWAPCSASVLTAQSLLSSRVCVCVCVCVCV